MNQQIQDRIRGCLIGGAAGDALGYAVEFNPWDQICLEYGEAGIRSYEVDPLSGLALISDDTQMTLFTANGILIGDTRGKLRGSQSYPRFYVWYSYLDWYQTQSDTATDPTEEIRSWLLDVPELHNRRAPGTTCMNALRAGKAGSVSEPINQSKGSGGIMRVAPLALRYQTLPYETLDREGAELAALTHGHSLGYIPSAVLVHIVHEIVYGSGMKSLEGIVLEAMDAADQLFKGDPELPVLRKLVERAVALSKEGTANGVVSRLFGFGKSQNASQSGSGKGTEAAVEKKLADRRARDLSAIRELGEGWTAEETLAVAVYCALRYQDDFTEAIIAAVNHDGDSDSTGAVTGNILGAWLGLHGIDASWQEHLELREVILEIADDLAAPVPLAADEPTKDPVWARKYVTGKRV